MRVPSNQLGGTTNVVDGFDSQTYWASADLSAYLVRGSLDQATNATILLVNDRVERQAGAPIPGLVGNATSTVVSRDDIGMGAGGDWFAFGATTASESFMIFNGALYLRDGDPVPGGLPGENYSFVRDAGVSESGDLAFIASTSLSRTIGVVDPAGPRPPFIVLLATVATLGTPCDLNGNGAADDDAFLGTLSDISIGSDGTLFFIGRVISSEFLTIGDGLFYFASLFSAPGDLNCDSLVDFGDITPFVKALSDPDGYAQQYPDCPLGNRDINSDGAFDFGDITPFVELLAGISTEGAT